MKLFLLGVVAVKMTVTLRVMNGDKISFGALGIGAIALAAICFGLSYNALHDLGKEFHVSPAWAFPLSVDLTIVIAMFAAYRTHRAGANVAAYRVGVYFFTFASVLLNISHVFIGELDEWTTWRIVLGVIVHAMPPFGLAVAQEILLHQATLFHDVSDKSRRSKARLENRGKSKRAKTIEKRHEQIDAMLTDGKTVAEIARALGVSDATIRRDIQQKA